MVFCCQESFPQVVALAGTTSTSLGGAFDGRPLTTNVPRQWDRFLGDGAVSDCLASPFPSGCNFEDNPSQWWIAGCPLALLVAHRQRGRPDPNRRDTRASPGRQVPWGDEEEAREKAEERSEAEGRLQDQGGDPQAADLRPSVQLDQVDLDGLDRWRATWPGPPSRSPSPPSSTSSLSTSLDTRSPTWSTCGGS